MDIKLVFFVVGVLIAITNGGKTEGKFCYGKRQCTWKELGSGKTLYRTLRIGCNGNKKKGIPALECAYNGNPHECDKYNGNEVKFYSCLVKKLMKSDQNDSPCGPEKVQCRRMCDKDEGWFHKTTTNMLEDLFAAEPRVMHDEDYIY